jgi:hypothetical protein
MPKILDKVHRALIDIQQSFARSSFCIDYVMVLKLNMEELQFIELADI